jgi:hypothetical protein
MMATIAVAMLMNVVNATAGSAADPIAVSVDARVHCIGLADGAAGQVAATIPSGRYEVTVDSSASYCEGGCSVEKVAFYITTDDQPTGWFYVVSEDRPTQVTVSGIGYEANTVRAFFLDALCSDNKGRAVLMFQRLDSPVAELEGEVDE